MLDAGIAAERRSHFFFYAAVGEHGGVGGLELNGKALEKLVLTPENNDLLHQFVVSGTDAEDGGTVALRFNGSGGLAYQVVGRYFVPWDQKPAGGPLSIQVDYDRTRLAQDDIATAAATVRNNLPRGANMVMVDLGIPPGFDLLSEGAPGRRRWPARIWLPPEPRPPTSANTEKVPASTSPAEVTVVPVAASDRLTASRSGRWRASSLILLITRML